MLASGFAPRSDLSVFAGFGFAKPRTSDRWDMRTLVMSGPTETHHLGVSILRLALHDEEVEIAVRTSVTTRTRAKEHDLDRIGSDSGQGPACHLYDLLRNHDDTVAKLPGGLWLAGSATMGCQRSALLIASATCQRACRPTGSISASPSRSRAMSAFSRCTRLSV